MLADNTYVICIRGGFCTLACAWSHNFICSNTHCLMEIQLKVT